MGVVTDSGDFRSLFGQKEKELVSVCERQIELFQQQLLERDSQYAELDTKFSRLKDDFKYNLELLDGRDAELTRYESEMAVLHKSIKTAQTQLLETQNRLSKTERQRLEERRNSEEKEKAYQQTLMSLRQQVESLHLTREELMSMHKEALENARAELMVQAERRHAHLDNRVKAFEMQYQDKLRIHELKSKLAVDAMENKLLQAERQIELLEDELDSQRAKLHEDARIQERKLRAEIRKRDGNNGLLKKDVDKLQTENDDLRSQAANADFRVEQLSHKLRRWEAEELKQSLRRRLQTEDIQKSLEMAESQASDWEIKRQGEISFNLNKIAQLEQVIVSEKNQMKLKLEAMETYVRDRLQHQDQKAKEFRSQAIYWKTQHDQLLTKYRALQNGNERSLGPDFIFDKLHGEDVITSEGVSASQPQFARVNDLLMSNSLSLGGRDKRITGSVHSMGSSLPLPSPLISPVFSSPEDNSQHLSGEHERNERVASLGEENRCLRESVQNLKEQNERIRTVVGTMRKEMEALQKTTLEEAFRSEIVGISPQKGHVEEMRKIRDEVQTLMSQTAKMTSELQQVQQMKPSLPVPSLQHTEKTEELAPSEDANSTIVSYYSKEAAAKIAELERVQHVLRTQLERAAHDLIRMANERDLLMEMSNSLHADLNRSHQHENSKHCGPATKDQNHVCSAKTTVPGPEVELHECRVMSPARRSTSPSRSPGRSGGRELSRGKNVWINKNGTVNVVQRDQEQNGNFKHTYADDAEEENEKRRLLLEGTMTPLKERPVLQQDFIRKGTPSQRSKLRASVKRREAQLAGHVKKFWKFHCPKKQLR